MNSQENNDEQVIKGKLIEIKAARNEFHGHGQVVSEQKLKIMQEIASKYGVTIKVAGTPGNGYITDSGFANKLGEGDFIVGIEAVTGQQVNDFWKEFDQVVKAKKYDFID